VKRVLLVNTNTVKAPYPVPPIGLSLLAASLETVYEVRIYDGTFDGPQGLPDVVATFRPDFVGVGLRNVDDLVLEAPQFYLESIRDEFVRPLRSLSSAPLILGGSAFSLFPEILLDFYEADFGIAGEAESAFPALLKALDQGGPIPAIPGLVYRSATGIIHVPSTCTRGQLNLPFARIDRHLDFEPYRRLGSYPIQTRRGCAHSCLYCTYPFVEGRAYRLRAPEAIADEIQETSERLPGTAFEFVDSTFNDPPGHAEAICREIIRRGLDVRLRTMGVNPGGATDELLCLMRRAGFAQIDCTPDSASPRVIRALAKNFNREGLERAAHAIHKQDMPTVWFFLFGGPDEDQDSVRETVDFIDRFVQPDDLALMAAGLRIFPGTPLHRRALHDGAVAPDDPLLKPTFYVSPRLGTKALLDLLRDAARTRPNCLPPGESSPGPEMMREAVILREQQGLREPMFRTLLRLRRAWPRFSNIKGPEPLNPLRPTGTDGVA
jgi:pyruvate-formate lyase-activating enzyme